MKTFLRSLLLAAAILIVGGVAHPKDRFPRSSLSLVNPGFHFVPLDFHLRGPVEVPCSTQRRLNHIQPGHLGARLIRVSAAG